MQSLYLSDERVSIEFGQCLAKLLRAPLVISFDGHLGMGKTTIIRALLRELGVLGAIKSPTFSIVEQYDTSNFTVNHFDCYRIHHADELEYIGFRDYFTEDAVCLIEWPQKAGAALKQVDLCFTLKLQHNGRRLELAASTETGLAVLESLMKQWGRVG